MVYQAFRGYGKAYEKPDHPSTAWRNQRKVDSALRLEATKMGVRNGLGHTTRTYKKYFIAEFPKQKWIYRI